MNPSMSRDTASGRRAIVRNWLERASTFVDSIEGSDLFGDLDDDDDGVDILGPRCPSMC